MFAITSHHILITFPTYYPDSTWIRYFIYSNSLKLYNSIKIWYSKAILEEILDCLNKVILLLILYNRSNEQI